MIYYFQFRGFSTLHHVFIADLPADAVPEPLNEIARCQWFVPSKIASLFASVPTRGIVVRRHRQMPPSTSLTEPSDANAGPSHRKGIIDIPLSKRADVRLTFLKI
jgi:8-oxo-dGTP diphosphatase